VMGAKLERALPYSSFPYHGRTRSGAGARSKSGFLHFQPCESSLFLILYIHTSLHSLDAPALRLPLGHTDVNLFRPFARAHLVG